MNVICILILYRAIIKNLGGIPERLKGPDCKSGGSAFAGSNPAPSTATEFSRQCR